MSGAVALEAIFVGPEAAGFEVPPGVPVFELAGGVVERVATTVTPQPVLAVARRPDVTVATLAGATFIVVAAGIQDPGNLGTILRVAEAAGADGVALLAGSVDPFSPKVVRASAGALFHVPVVPDTTVAEVAEFGLPLLGTAAAGGTPYDEAPLEPPVAVVLGSEAHGLPPELAVDGLVSVPHAGRAESLNVAMAAAVVCFEVARRTRRRETDPGASGPGASLPA
jgi:TrmH family RNA methyltransferase